MLFLCEYLQTLEEEVGITLWILVLYQPMFLGQIRLAFEMEFYENPFFPYSLYTICSLAGQDDE